MLAAGKQRGEDAQICIAEQPTFCLAAGGPGRANNRAKVFAAGHGAKVLGADSRQAGNFILGEYFLVGFDRDHLWPPFIGMLPWHFGASAAIKIKFLTHRHYFPCKSSAVSFPTRSPDASTFPNNTIHEP